MDSSQNNPFGSFSSGGVGPSGFSAPVSSGAGGDIVLAPSAPNKSKQKLIIGVVIVLIVLALVGFVFMLTRKGGAPNVSNTGKESFYRYANYVLYDEDSTSALEGEFDDNEYYALEDLDEMNNSEKKAFLLKAENLLNDFDNYLDKVGEGEFKNKFSEYRAEFELTKMINTVPGLNNSEFLNNYFSLDKDGLKKWIENRFSEYTNSGYELVKGYGENGVKYYGLYTDYMDELKAEGCVNEYNEFDICEEGSGSELESEMEDLRYEMDDAESVAMENVVKDCFTISKMLNGEYDKNGGDE